MREIRLSGLTRGRGNALPTLPLIPDLVEDGVCGWGKGFCLCRLFLYQFFVRYFFVSFVPLC